MLNNIYDAEADIFISYNSKDEKYANYVYEYLVKRGLRVFYSGKSLYKAGSSRYIEVIHKAIENCTHMVVVGSCYENIGSEWVKYEINLFINVMLNKKTGNLVPVLAGDLKVDALPVELRYQQAFCLGQENFSEIVNFLQVEGKCQADNSATAAAVDNFESVFIDDFAVVEGLILDNISWYEAVRYAKNLKTNGCNDWHLPTKDQLKAIRNAEAFPITSCYWACHESDDDNAMYCDYHEGTFGYLPKNFSSGLSAVFAREVLSKIDYSILSIIRARVGVNLNSETIKNILVANNPKLTTSTDEIEKSLQSLVSKKFIYINKFGSAQASDEAIKLYRRKKIDKRYVVDM